MKVFYFLSILLVVVTCFTFSVCNMEIIQEKNRECVVVINDYPFYDMQGNLTGKLLDSLLIYKANTETLYEFISTEYLIDSLNKSMKNRYKKIYFYSIKDSIDGFLYNSAMPSRSGFYNKDSTIRSYGNVLPLPENSSEISINGNYNFDSSLYRKIVTVSSKYINDKDSIIYTYSSEMKGIEHNLSSDDDFNYYKGMKLIKVEMNFFLPNNNKSKSLNKYKGIIKMESQSIDSNERSVDSLFRVLKKRYYEIKSS